LKLCCDEEEDKKAIFEKSQQIYANSTLNREGNKVMTFINVAYIPVSVTLVSDPGVELKTVHGVDVFVILFSIDSQRSLTRVSGTFVRGIREEYSTAKIMLVGLKANWRTDAQKTHLCIPDNDCAQAARGMAAVHYMEIDATDDEDVKRLLDKAAELSTGLILKPARTGGGSKMQNCNIM
jgi:hypothetical protein